MNEDTSGRTHSSLTKIWIPFFGFLLVAVLIRIPYLHQIPSLIESNELRITLDLVHGKNFPLNDFRPYLGALFTYITAGAFRLFGMHYWVPRTIVLLASSATIPLVYFLGKRLLGKPEGALAAVLMAGCAYHVFFLSHVAWPNSLTPFLITATLLCFVIGLQEQRTGFLIATGFLFGLALQTHPTCITILPALLAIFLLQGKDRIRSWLRRPKTYLVLLAAAAGYANMLYYFVFQRAGDLTEIHKARYVEKNLATGTYLYSLKSEILLLLRLISSAGEDEFLNGIYFKNPWFVLCTLALVAGLILCVAKRKYALILLLASPLLILPTFNSGYDYYQFGRYLGFVVPVALLIVAFAAAELIRVLQKKYPERKLLSPILLGSLAAGFLCVQLNALATAYVNLKATGDTMEIYQRLRTTLGTYGKQNVAVLMDPLAFKSTPMRVYLETDGWSVDGITGIRPRNVKGLKSDQLADLLHQQRDSIIHTDPKKSVIAVLSPGVSDILLGGPKHDAYVGCIVDLAQIENPELAKCYTAKIVSYERRRQRRHHHH